ncbi:hypothetical protein [Bacillus toyonensis]
MDIMNLLLYFIPGAIYGVLFMKCVG